MDIKCPNDLNQFILGEPTFKNTFSKKECEQRKFYGDCHHCFATTIAKRDRQLKASKKKQDEPYQKDKGVLKQLAENQNSLLTTTKAWSEAIEKHGDIY